MSVVFENNATTFREFGEANPVDAYRLHLAIVHEDDGTVSAIALNLPGAGSCGDTEEEAVANAKNAVSEVIRSYLDEKKEIPWNNDYNQRIPEDAKIKRELVQLDG